MASSGIDGGYLGPEAFRDAVRGAASMAGERALLRTIGETVRGAPIDAVTLSAPGRRPDPSRPQGLVIACIHGCEVISSQLALALLQAAAADPPSHGADALLAGADLTLVPVVNVDGRTASVESLSAVGLLKRAPRRNANGVDLNRNWPFPAGVSDHWLPISGTRRRWLPWYRGEAPLSEPETRAVESLVRELRPFGLLNLHSTGSIVVHPWACREEPPADQVGFRAMTEAFRAAQPHVTYRAKQSRAWYPIIGSSNDYFYDRHGVLAMTVETSPHAGSVKADLRLARWVFWYANPTNPRFWIENDRAACFAALAAAHEYRLTKPRGSGSSA